jgi:F0F1-type ATP synthase membrane subunit a
MIFVLEKRRVVALFNESNSINSENIFKLGRKMFNWKNMIIAFLIIAFIFVFNFISAMTVRDVSYLAIYILSALITIFILYSILTILFIVISYIRDIRIKKKIKNLNDKNLFIRYELNGNTTELEEIVKKIKGNFEKDANIPHKVEEIKKEIRKGILININGENLDEMLNEVKNWILYLKTKPEKKNVTSIIVSIILSFAGLTWISEGIPKIYTVMLKVFGSTVENTNLFENTLIYILLVLIILLMVIYFVTMPEAKKEKNRLYLLFLESILEDIKEEIKQKEKNKNT